MQILQWLFKVAHESPRKTITQGATNDQRAKSENMFFFTKKLNPFGIFQNRREIAKACFFGTLNLKRLRISFRPRKNRIYSMKMVKREEIDRGALGKNQKAEYSGNKVSPMDDAALSSSIWVEKECGMEGKREKAKGEKSKSFSRMKELLRWATDAKSEEGGKVLQLRDKVTPKAVSDDDQLSDDSPKISWDFQSCPSSSSTTSSAYSAISTHLHCTENCPPSTGNWITTDSEFVVLEL